MATKQKHNRNETKKIDPESSNKLVDLYQLKDMNVIEFKVLLVRNGKEEKAFGGGAFKKEDLQHIAAELAQFARELELTEAEAKGYHRAIEERENENQNQENNDEQNDNNDQDNENDNDDNDDQDQDEQYDEYLNI